MGLLKSLVDKTKGWLGLREQAQPVRFTDAVMHDRFDAQVFENLCADVPPLRHMIDELHLHYDHAPEMVRDVLMQFWQSDPLIRQQSEMDPGYVRNHAVATDVHNSPETSQTRTYTRHDRYGAAMATLAVAEKVKSFLTEQDALNEAQDEADQARAEAGRKQAEADLEAELAEALAGDYDGEGPLTEGQTEALEALEAALAAAQAAQEAAEAADEKVQQEAAQAARRMALPVSEAVKEAGEALAEEAELFRAWGVNDGELKQMDFEERRLLATRLRSGRLAKFSKLIGRRRVAAAAQRSRKTEYGRDEVVGVEMSNDIPRVLEAEWAKSRSRIGRLDFLSRFAEGQLLSRRFVGIEKVRQGSIIALCDTSGSMDQQVAGITREAWAKATMLSMLDQARAERRDFVWINFSSRNQVKTWYFPKGESSLAQVMQAAEHHFDGGTDFAAPLDHAMDVLEANPDLKGDVVLITDDDCRVTPEWMRQYQARKARLSFRTFGIAVGHRHREDGTLATLSDNTRSVLEFADPNDIAGLIHVL